MKGIRLFRTLTGFAALYGVMGPSPAYASNSNHPTVICVVGLVAGVFLFFWGFFQLRTKRLMEDIPTSTIRAMAPGLVEIIGQAVDWEPFQGPFTLQRCVYYEFLVEQWVNSGKNSHWQTILKGDSKSAPFYVQDGTGTVMVLPEKATAILPVAFELKTGVFTEVPVAMVEFLDQKSISCRTLFGFEKTLRFTERHFLPGETMFVMGTCEQTPSHPEFPPEGALPDVGIVKGSRSGDIFILSNESQKQLESSFALKSFLGIFGGLALVAVCVWGILKIWGVN
ncbi:MAG TPA: GIDE domain-containing protein [bacterium]|jgi:hypothetical protein|nr:GIDE domain-containing protein [bacterium]